jgi:tRNA(fMet)-specific endonuclease VapC
VSAKGNPVEIAVPVLAELVYGIERSATRERNMKLLQAALPTLRLWPFDQDAAFEYGRLYAELLRIGRPMQVPDIMIAAVALTLGKCTVVSKDSDLSAVPGLSVENWAS